MMKRVVVTGMGLVSPIGSSYDAMKESLLHGVSGVSLIEDMDSFNLPVKIAARVKNFDYQSIDYDQKTLQRTDPFIWYGIEAGIQAVNNSLLLQASFDPQRVGIIIGSGIGGLSTIEQQHFILQSKGARWISPFFIPSTIINLISGHLAIRFGFQGPNLATATACSTGTHAIAQAFDMIQLGYADVMLAGGAEKASCPLGIAGFAAAKALSTRNDQPSAASRPWDQHRDGFVLGDGSAVLVLEEYEHAKARRAPILAEMLSGSFSADAYHMTQPHPEGRGAAQAMKQALDRAQIKPQDIDYINAHGTSTLIGDVLEIKSIRRVFGDHASQLHISSTKSMTGHLLGAAGALEAAICIMSLIEGFVPPTINLEHPEPACADLQLTPIKSIKATLNIVLSNSFGFGGTNGSLIFKKI
ncbi:beta-ketoacyl-[acyl-carrier-protein] synthase II [bacterium]|nr:beta-ketoacyl-[acyl-carrier-protein] synthase II [bacterium]NBW56488.1 beta-ketoacyl-[acyl-carrier-protein] synthase II [bacterium]NBX71541.1 beta-ketoacyl-[acyl-carrier-protein] synthase II [bacterium]